MKIFKQLKTWWKKSGSTIYSKSPVNATTAFQFQKSDGTSVLNVDTTNSRVGIGTTSPGAKLHSIASSGVVAGRFTGTDGQNGLEIFGGTTSGQSFGLLIDAGSTSGDYALDIRKSDNTAIMRVRGDGNVGIGTTSPGAKLDINNGGSGANLYLTNSLGASGRFYVGTGDNNLNLGTFTNNRMNLYSNSQVRMTILETGNVGIGTTSPLVKFQTNVGTNRNIGFSITSDTARISAFTDSGSSQIPLRLEATQFEIMNGNVGIGTTSPSAKLDVVGGKLSIRPVSGAGIIVSNDENEAPVNDGTAYIYRTNGLGASYPFNDYGHLVLQPRTSLARDILFYTGSTTPLPRMTILNSGNVGIGTTSPTEKLEVDGNILASGYVTGKKVGVYAYLSSPADTTITTAATYYPVAGTFTNGPIEDFGAATTYTPGIKYTGTKTQYFEVDWHATLSADVATTTVHLGIKKNGTLVSGSEMASLLKNADQEYNVSGTAVVELATNDEIQLIVTSDGDGDIITFHHYTTTITEFFD